MCTHYGSIAKYSPLGILQWVGDIDDQMSWSIVADHHGDVFSTGRRLGLISATKLLPDGTLDWTLLAISTLLGRSGPTRAATTF